MRRAVIMILLLGCACVQLFAQQLHNAHPMEPISAKWSPPRQAKLKPVRIAGPRNGVYSGMVIYSGTLKTPAKISDLTGDRDRIPARDVRIRYASRQHDLGDGRLAREGKRDTFDALSPKPDQTAEFQPIPITVHIPADAKEGKYTGTLTVAGHKAKVVLAVADYDLPNPHEWVIWCSMQQSPASVATRYNVQPYSDRFFKLLESSFKLMGQLGNNVLYDPIIGKNMHGDEHGVIHFRSNGKTLTPDFTNLKQYVKLYVNHCAPPPGRHRLRVRSLYRRHRTTMASPSGRRLPTKAEDQGRVGQARVAERNRKRQTGQPQVPQTARRDHRLGQGHPRPPAGARR